MSSIMDQIKDGVFNNSYEWYSALSQANLILSFKGDFNQELVKAILILTQNRDHIKNENVILQTRLFGVLVECLQNICKHGVGLDDNSDLKPGIVLIGRTANSFRISTGNLISNEEVPELRKKIERINASDAPGLRALQQEILSDTEELNKNSGAGIGLIYIARRSGEKLEFDFKEMDDKNSFYSLEVTLPTEV